MSILCPVCSEPPLCTCQIERMNKRLVAAESDNKRLRGHLEVIRSRTCCMCGTNCPSCYAKSALEGKTA